MAEVYKLTFSWRKLVSGAKVLILAAGLLLSNNFIYAEEPATPASADSVKKKDCEQQALGDWIKHVLKKDGEKKQKPPKKFLALVLPNISSNPTNGFLLGVGGSFGWYMGPKENTRVSSAPFTVAVTSKSQLITFLKHNIYTKENNYFLQGDWKFYIYSQPTYGLGTNAPDTGKVPTGVSWQGAGTSNSDVVFPMKFNYIKVHEIVNRKIIDNLYGGIGYHLDYYYSINDEYYHPDSVPPQITPHSYYSDTNGFSRAQYTLSGLSLNFLYDSRDNQINPYKGIYANINYRINTDWLGSAQNSSTLWLEFRTYLRLSKNTPRHLIGFWVFGDFMMSGKLPYLTLPYLGEDQRARSGRGYTNGRYRGDNIVYGEAEWRFPISQCSKILGGVVFVNATTTSSSQGNVKLFEYIRPAVGFGIRVMVNKYFRTNINLDYAIGVKSSGFYFSGQETF
jgi:outer membrane protein assembly factor BamA